MAAGGVGIIDTNPAKTSTPPHHRKKVFMPLSNPKTYRKMMISPAISYSVFKLSTGLASAARTLCTLTVTSATSNNKNGGNNSSTHPTPM